MTHLSGLHFGDHGSASVFGNSVWNDNVTPILLLNLEGKIMGLNLPAASFLSSSIEELRGNYVWQCFSPNVGNRNREAMQQAVGTRKLQRTEILHNGKWFEVIVRPCFGENGEIIGVSLVAFDITEQHQMQEDLAQAERRLRFTLDNADVGMWELDWATGKAWWAPEGARVFGFAEGSKAWHQADFIEHVLPEDKPRVDQVIQAGLDAGKNWTFECRIQREADEVRWIWVNCGLTLTQEGLPLRTNGVVKDITEQKSAQEALRQNEARLNNAIKGSKDATWEWNVQTGQTVFNERWAEMVGYRLSDLAPISIRTWLDLSHPEDLRASQEQLIKVFAREQQHYDCEGRMKRRDGEWVWIHNRGDVVEWLADGRPLRMAGTNTDITERKRLELALRQSDQMQRTILASMVEGVVLQDADGTILNCNKAAEEILGLTRGQILGRTSLDPRWRAIHEGGSEFVGTEHPAMLSLQTGKGYRNVPMGLHFPDGSLRWIEINSEPLFRPGESRPYSVITSFSDCTVRRQMEEQLRQSQKMEVIGQLAGGMAHEFNNILATMMMSLSLAQMDGETTNHRLLTDLEDSCQRAAGIIKQLLAFGRRSVMHQQTLNLGEVVQDYLRTLEPLLGEAITLHLQVAEQLPLVQADKTLFEQLLLNLCLNARDAMKKGGQLRLELGAEEVEAGSTKFHPDASPGRFVFLSVSDSGSGMDEQTVKRLFEPFFTTKEVGKGTGLGLATVRGIVQQHRGWVAVNTELGKGSTFKVYLPVSEPPTIPGPSLLISMQSAKRENLTILVAEDDAKLRRLSVLLLTQQGYRVLEAPDGATATVLWESHRNEIDLLYSDIVMPGAWTGLQLAERFKAERSDLKVILTSGYNTDFLKIEEAGASGIVYLPKPCPPDRLLDVVRQCLQAKATES